MRRARIRHLLVVDEGRLVGVVGLRDLLEVGFSEARDEIQMLHAYISYVPPGMAGG
jgi:CBS domain-containing protein